MKIQSKNIIKLSEENKERLKKAIIEYVWRSTYAITAKYDINHINSKLNTEYLVGFIKKFMKIQANLNIKKVKSRPSNIDFDWINAVQNLFYIKFAKLVTKDTLLVNIDKSSINRNIKQKYSWGFKGTPIVIANSICVGSISMIMAIWSNGSWINFFFNENYWFFKFHVVF